MIIADHDSEYQYETWIGDHHEMGYKITDPNGEVSYFYLNPSGGSDDGVPTIFVYHGRDGDSSMDGAVSHFVVSTDELSSPAALCCRRYGPDHDPAFSVSACRQRGTSH